MSSHDVDVVGCGAFTAQLQQPLATHGVAGLAKETIK